MTPSPFSRPPRRVPGDPQLRARDEKLEALKAVAGKLAHDFNNFLVPQFGYLTLLKEELPANTTSAEYAARMEAAGRKTEGYIESILLGMRPHRQFSPATFSFGGLVDEQLEKWTAGIPPGTEIRVHQEIEPGALVGDERHWRSAVSHLLSNARYALATGGDLHVSLKTAALEGTEVLRLGLDSADVLQFTMRDSGFGMSPETAARAFEPFFTTRTQIKAAGLGLTIVHAVTQFHGGQIELASAENEGTTVTLWIPLNGVNTRDKLASLGTAARTPPVKKRKVLLIEDDPLINEVLRDWLGRFDFDVQVAATAEDALKHLARKNAEWSLAIVEADLAHARGEDIYARLQPAHPSLPWIFLAGRRKPVLPSENAPAESRPLVIQKPFTLPAFAEIVRQILIAYSRG